MRNSIRPVLSVLVISLLASCVLWQMRSADVECRARIFTFPDGSEGELLGTAIGGEAFTTDSGLERIARRYLPVRFKRWLPVVYDVGMNSSFGSNTLMVYLRFFPHSQRNFEPIGGFDSLGYRWGSYQTVDATGFCYPRCPADMIVRHASSGAEIYSFGVKAYVRQQPEFLLHWWDDKGAVIATLNVPNRIRGPFPEWQPLPLPQTQTSGPVALTLETLRETTNGSSCFLKPEFRIKSSNAGWANANVFLEKLLDATGNESSPVAHVPGGFLEMPPDAADGEIGVLSPCQPAWKLRAVVDRKHPQDFTASEKIVLTTLPLPAPGQFVAIDRTAECAGVVVKARILAGGGTFCVNSEATRSMSPPDQSLKDRGSEAFWSASGTLPVERTWSSEGPFMLVETQSAQPGDEIQIYAFDDGGHEVGVVMHTCDPEIQGDTGYEPTFVPPAGAKISDGCSDG